MKVTFKTVTGANFSLELQGSEKVGWGRHMQFCCETSVHGLTDTAWMWPDRGRKADDRRKAGHRLPGGVPCRHPPGQGGQAVPGQPADRGLLPCPRVSGQGVLVWPGAQG